MQDTIKSDQNEPEEAVSKSESATTLFGGKKKSPPAKGEQSVLPSLEERNAATINIKKLSLKDLGDAIEEGFEDFRKESFYSLVIGALFAFGGLVVFTLLTMTGMPHLLFPALIGITLIAPFLAAALYEIARRREKKKKINSEKLFEAMSMSTRDDYGALGLLTIGLIVLWLVVAMIHYTLFFGFTSLSIGELASKVFTTPAGWTFLSLGNLMGLVFASILFAMSAFSFQLLFEHDFGVSKAMSTSMEAVSANAFPMMIWAAVISTSMAISFISGFLPLIVVMPLLGYISWHLYRKTLSVAQ